MTMTSIRLPTAATAIARANRASSHTHTHTNNANLRCLSTVPPNRQSDNEAWWSLSSLHKRVATIIATSLPNESLSVVHKSLSEKLNEVDSHKSVSINEAIVSAHARDAHHQTLNGGIVNGNTSLSVEKQKQLEKEIEQRALEKAQERMQLELEAMKQQMKRKEEQRIQKEREEHERELAFERWKENAAREQQRDQEVEDVAKQQEETSNDNAHHPILGPQIAHLPYKRIHLTSASTLASLPVYEKQRAYRHDRATNMAKDKKKTLWMGIPGVISLMEEDDGRLSILDGQHRVGMMALLEEEQRKGQEKGKGTSNHELVKLDLENVLVEVFFPRQSSDSDSESVLASSSQKQTPEQHQQIDDKAVIFTEINKAEPVKLLDLPGVAPKRTRDMIDHAASHFYNTYPAMFSPSTRCRAVSWELSFVVILLISMYVPT